MKSNCLIIIVILSINAFLEINIMIIDLLIFDDGF